MPNTSSWKLSRSMCSLRAFRSGVRGRAGAGGRQDTADCSKRPGHCSIPLQAIERNLATCVQGEVNCVETSRGTRGFGYSAQEELYPWAEPDDPRYQRNTKSGGEDLCESDENEANVGRSTNGDDCADIGDGDSQRPGRTTSCPT